MGVMYIEWRNSLTVGVGLALAMIALAGVARITLLSRQHTGDDTASPAPDRDGFAGSIGGSIAGSIGISGAEEWFWCFLRAAVEETLLLTQLSLDLPAYWSIWIAATLALPFSLLSRSNAYHVNAYHWLVKGAILVMTSILFFYTRNFWLCWAVHAIIWLLLAQPAAVQITSTRKSRSQQSPKRG
jgi:ABC-type phosphate/phosphonate transport system permease subunit